MERELETAMGVKDFESLKAGLQNFIDHQGI